MAVTLQQCLGCTPDKAHYLPSSVLPSNNLVGVEVELENIPRAEQTLDYWRVTRDGSLRDNGVEFVLANPTCGQTLIDALSELGTYLKDTKAKASDRTSVHVHLDFRGNTVDQTFQFLMMYAILERTLIKYAGGESRANSIYCIPLYKSFETIREWGQLNEKAIGSDVSTRNACAHAVDRSEKYAACNIKPLARFGSVEIRIHKGCKDMGRILEWVQILLALKLYTDTVQIDFEDMFNTMSEEGYEGIIPAIFGHGVQCDLLTMQSGVNDDLGRGMRVAQDILHQWSIRHRNQTFPTDEYFDNEGGHPLLQKKHARSAPKRSRMGDKCTVDMEATQYINQPTARPVTAERDRNIRLTRERLRGVGWVGSPTGLDATATTATTPFDDDEEPEDVD